MNEVMFSMLMAKWRELPYRCEEGIGQRGVLVLRSWCVVVVVVVVSVKEMDFFEVLLELAVIYKCIFPFRDQLPFKLLRELHHFLSLRVVEL